MTSINWLSFPHYTDEYLRSLHTKQLLMLLRGPSRMGWSWSEDYEVTSALDQKLRAILATREHVPNKREGKKARQLAAKRKR